MDIHLADKKYTNFVMPILDSGDLHNGGISLFPTETIAILSKYYNFKPFWKKNKISIARHLLILVCTDQDGRNGRLVTSMHYLEGK